MMIYIASKKRTVFIGHAWHLPLCLPMNSSNLFTQKRENRYLRRKVRPASISTIKDQQPKPKKATWSSPDNLNIRTRLWGQKHKPQLAPTNEITWRADQMPEIQLNKQTKSTQESRLIYYHHHSHTDHTISISGRFITISTRKKNRCTWKCIPESTEIAQQTQKPSDHTPKGQKACFSCLGEISETGSAS